MQKIKIVKTHYDIILMYKTLRLFINTRLPQQLSFVISENINILNEKCQKIENEIQCITNKYSEFLVYDENKNLIIKDDGFPKIKGDKEKCFLEEIDVLLTKEIELDMYFVNFNLFCYSDVDKYSSLTPNEITALKSILCN